MLSSVYITPLIGLFVMFFMVIFVQFSSLLIESRPSIVAIAASSSTKGVIEGGRYPELKLVGEGGEAAAVGAA